MGNRFFLLVILCLILPFSGLAQKEEESQGEIEDVQVEIVKDREIILPPAVRKFDKIPPQDEKQEPPSFDYNFGLPSFSFTPLDLRLRPLRIKDEPLQKTYGNYVAAGFGNFATPYLEGYVNSKRDVKKSVGAHLRYMSSAKGAVDDNNSGNSDFQADIFGTYYGPKASLSGDLGYRRRGLNFYGYPDGFEADDDSISQTINHVFAEAIINNTDVNANLDYKLAIGVDYLSDKRDMSEVMLSAISNNMYELSEKTGLHLNLSYDFINYSNRIVDGQSRHLLKVQPRIKFDLNNINIVAGFNAAYENDTLGTADDLHFYPFADVSYMLIEGWQVFARLSGDMNRVAYNTKSYENPWLGPENYMFHSNTTFALSGGLKSRLSNSAAFKGGVSFKRINNMPFFLNSNHDVVNEYYGTTGGAMGYFSMVYNTSSTTIFSFFGEISYTANNGIYGNLNGQYNTYGTGDFEGAFHLPDWEVKAEVFYPLVDKIHLGMNFNALGGITTLDNSNQLTTLDAAVDMGFKVDYLLSDRVSIFVNLDNVFNQNYQIFDRYPVRGFQFLGGLTYNF